MTRTDGLPAQVCRGLRTRLWRLAGLSVLAAGCGAGESPPLSDFATEIRVTGLVVENDTGCTVDAVCGLRLSFADTTVLGVYGTGERPATSCAPIAVSLSDRAFAVEPGAVVDVVLERCPEVGLVVRELERP